MKRVLVVDDELDICFMISAYLRKISLEVQYAQSIREAMAKVENNVYQLAFIDIDLTDGSGFDMISHLRKAKLDLKIIVISAHHNEKHKALEIGANLFIAKPFSTQAINEALKILNFLAL